MGLRDAHRIRRRFYRGLWQGLRVTWPILSGLLLMQAAVGIFIAWLEGWYLTEGVYFAYITGLTIGYGDLAPVHRLSRLLAVGIGFIGILITGLVAALGVKALQAATSEPPSP